MTEDIARGRRAAIITWQGFKDELKQQFYPESATDEARAKLRHLKQSGTIREYVKDFTELLLEIPDMSDSDVLFAFIDGLQGWVKLELKRRGVQNLADAIRVAESLIEFKKESIKERPSKKDNNASGGGARRDKGKEPARGSKTATGQRKPLECFICDGPHMARECPSRGKLAAMVIQGDTEEAARHQNMSAVRLLGAVGAKAETSRKGPMFAEIRLKGQPFQALVDTGASDIMITKEVAAKMEFAMERAHGTMKAVNSVPKPLVGTVKRVPVQLGEWTGHTDIIVAEMDDYDVVMGLEFLEEQA